jgi:hypothetical protein
MVDVFSALVFNVALMANKEYSLEEIYAMLDCGEGHKPLAAQM